MAPLVNTDGVQKDTGAIEVEKVTSLDASNVPQDLNATLTEEEKKTVKRATYDPEKPPLAITAHNTTAARPTGA
jgi:hypothetical protein